MTESPSDLIFNVLCARFKSAKVLKAMTRQELQEATGLSERALRDALQALRGPNDDQDSKIAYEGERIALGWSWRGTCEDKGRSA